MTSSPAVIEQDAPLPTRAMVLRPRLLAVLKRRWDHRVTAVVANAGFGKTTLLAQAVSENALDTAGLDVWVSCRATHAAASVLVRDIAAALGIADVDPADSPDALAEVVIGAVAARAPTPVALILDDAHALPAGSNGALLVGELIERLPTNGHLVLASRPPPPVPLARLVAQGRAVRLVEDDLAFTDDELEEFACLRDVDVDDLTSAARWPAIVELTAVAGRPLVREFVWEEVLGSLDATARRHLAVLAAIDGADQATLGAAVEEPVDLDRLVRDLPLASREGDVVRLHALWGEPLAGELDPTEGREACRRAAVHHQSQERRLSAFRLFVDADDLDAALTVVRDVCSHPYSTVSADVLDGWLSELTPRLDGRPEVVLLRAVLAKLRTGDPSAAIPLIEQAVAAFRDAGSAVGELAAMTQLFDVGFIIRDGHAQATAMFRAVELADAGCDAARPLAGLARAGLAISLHDHAGAIAELEAIPRADLTDDWNAARDWMHGEQLVSLGRPDEALAVYERSRGHRSGTVADLLEASVIFATFLAGRVDEAVEHGEDSLTRRGHDTPSRYAEGMESLLARFCAPRGGVAAATDHLERARAYGAPADVVLRSRIATSEAAVAVAHGDEARAATVLRPEAEDDLQAQRRCLALPYVLLSDTRAYWAAHDLGPVLARQRDLATALVALREDRDLAPMRHLEALDPGLVRSALPMPWAAEVAVAREAVGSPDGRELLADLGAPAGPWVDRLRSSPDKQIAHAARRLLTEVPTVPGAAVRVRLFGPAELWHDDVPVDTADWRRDRVRQLLGFLVTHPQTTREAVADALWPGLDRSAGANNLRATLSFLLRVLEPHRADKAASYFVAQRGNTLRLTGHDLLDVDVWAFDRHLEQANRAGRDGAPSLERRELELAVDQYHGTFLIDADAGWSEADADRLRLAFVGAACRAAELAMAAGDHRAVDHLTRCALVADPWSERAYQVLVASHLGQGDRSAAQRTLERCLAMLRDLGVDPGSDTRMLSLRLHPTG